MKKSHKLNAIALILIATFIGLSVGVVTGYTTGADLQGRASYGNSQHDCKVTPTFVRGRSYEVRCNEDRGSTRVKKGRRNR